MEIYRGFRNSWDVINHMSVNDSGLLLAALDLDRVVESLYGKLNWGFLRGKTLLDLGCGSRLTPRRYHPFGWPPYFCLLAAAKGARAYGIDYYPAAPEDRGLYYNVQADLVNYVVNKHLGEIPEIRGASFDAIHSLFLTLEGNNTLDWRCAVYGISLIQFRDLLKFQAGELLKLGGSLLLDTEGRSEY